MRTMARNRQVFYAADLISVGMSQDTDGNYVENTFNYSDPVKHEGVFTPADGRATVQLFGANEVYDKVITLNQGENYLVVGSVLWVDTMPEIDKETGKTETPYDYIVVGVSKSLNFVNIAIRKVTAS